MSETDKLQAQLTLAKAIDKANAVVDLIGEGL